MASMRLLTPHQVHLTQATHLSLTTQGRGSMEGTALDDDDQTPQARPTQAIVVVCFLGTRLCRLFLENPKIQQTSSAQDL